MFRLTRQDDYCKSKHVALVLHSIIVVLTAIYSNLAYTVKPRLTSDLANE